MLEQLSIYMGKSMNIDTHRIPYLKSQLQLNCRPRRKKKIIFFRKNNRRIFSIFLGINKNFYRIKIKQQKVVSEGKY